MSETTRKKKDELEQKQNPTPINIQRDNRIIQQRERAIVLAELRRVSN